jgi:hypothetical protein
MDARHTPLKVSPLLVDRRGKEEIANGVPAWCARLSWKSKAQQICCRGLGVRKGNEAVSQVTDGRDTELPSKDP